VADQLFGSLKVFIVFFC